MKPNESKFCKALKKLMEKYDVEIEGNFEVVNDKITIVNTVYWEEKDKFYSFDYGECMYPDLIENYVIK